MSVVFRLSYSTRASHQLHLAIRIQLHAELSVALLQPLQGLRLSSQRATAVSLSCCGARQARALIRCPLRSIDRVIRAGEQAHHGDEIHDAPRTPICQQHLINRDGVGTLQHLHSMYAEVKVQSLQAQLPSSIEPLESARYLCACAQDDQLWRPALVPELLRLKRLLARCSVSTD